MKKAWKEPQVEVLNVRETMLGTGTTHVDWVWVGSQLDADLYDNGQQTGGNTGPILAS